MTKKTTHYIIQTAQAQMPLSVKSRYGKIAVLEVDADRDSASMISERAKGCHRIVAVWDRLNIGKTEACAYQRAMAEAREMCAKLNGQGES